MDSGGDVKIEVESGDGVRSEDEGRDSAETRNGDSTKTGGAPTTTKSPTQAHFTTPTLTQRPTSTSTSNSGLTLSPTSATAPTLPLPATSPSPPSTTRTGALKRSSKPEPIPVPPVTSPSLSPGGYGYGGVGGRPPFSAQTAASQFTLSDPNALLPARMPPKSTVLDIWPLSLVAKHLVRHGKANVSGRKAARLRAKLGGMGADGGVKSKNLPLEISFYLSSYLAAQQARGVPPSGMTAFYTNLQALVDALTGLERILTTPIPFSYAAHLWTVTTLYCLLLPFQVWSGFKWLTIPATAILSFIFFGFLVAGEEIENPFGYDANDLNMDHFTHNIIRAELRSLASTPPPKLEEWAFSRHNDCALTPGNWVREVKEGVRRERVEPEEWVRRGMGAMRGALAEDM